MKKYLDIEKKQAKSFIFVFTTSFLLGFLVAVVLTQSLSQKTDVGVKDTKQLAQNPTELNASEKSKSNTVEAGPISVTARKAVKQELSSTSGDYVAKITGLEAYDEKYSLDVSQELSDVLTVENDGVEYEVASNNYQKIIGGYATYEINRFFGKNDRYLEYEILGYTRALGIYDIEKKEKVEVNFITGHPDEIYHTDNLTIVCSSGGLDPWQPSIVAVRHDSWDKPLFIEPVEANEETYDTRKDTAFWLMHDREASYLDPQNCELSDTALRYSVKDKTTGETVEKQFDISSIDFD